MDEKTSALFSEYIIDGVPQELTPARMLDVCLTDAFPQASEASFAPIVDETLDPALKPCVTSPGRIDAYLRQVRALKERVFPVPFADTFTRNRIAQALLDAIWRKGHFRLGDLSLSLDWSWRGDRIGDMAAFYQSVGSASEYIDALGLRISSYGYTPSAGESDVKVEVQLSCDFPCQHEDEEPFAGEDDFFDELPFRTEHPRLRSQNLPPSRMLPQPQSWLIYIPFENADYRLGASALAQVLGVSGAVAPKLEDPDYFIDCYEVVRELVEDGVVIAGVTVGEGGLISALRRFTSPKAGTTADLSGLARAKDESDIVRLLFSEVPGVLIQIADLDYDYVDAELLLQDVAFYPLGHPEPQKPGVRVRSDDRSGIQTILESLIRNQSPEGED